MIQVFGKTIIQTATLDLFQQFNINTYVLDKLLELYGTNYYIIKFFYSLPEILK
jgi:hypothetical protein